MSYNAALSSSISKTIAFNDYTVSAVALLWHDWLLTFDDEVEFIWKQRWGMGKVLYILNRFVPMVDLLILAISYSEVSINMSLCRPWWYIDTWLSIMGFLVMDVVLLLRTWALWNRSKRILAILLISIIISALSAGGASLYASIVVTTDVATVDNIRPCGSSFPNVKPLYGIWAGLILYDSVVMLLILIKAIPVFLTMPLSPTLKTFFQDGFIYYIIIFAAAFANILMISFAPGELATTLFTFHRSMSSLLGSRMILNLRGVIMRPSAFANMDNGVDLMGEESMAMSAISGMSRSGGGVRRSYYGPTASVSRAGHKGLRSIPGADDDDMELSEIHRWQREGDDDEASRPKSATDLTGGVKVHISTAVRWEGDLEAEPWSAGKQ